LALINYKPLTYQHGNYEYPLWAHIVGWCITGATLLCIPVFAFFNLINAEGPNIKTRYKHSLRPNIYECSLCHEHNCEHEEEDQDFHLFPITLQPPPLITKKQNGVPDNHRRENSENSEHEKATTSGKSQSMN
jgi:hypothetical protein